MTVRGLLRLQVASQMKEIVDMGINSFKFFMAYKGALMVGDELLLDGLQRCKQLGALAMVLMHPVSLCTFVCSSVKLGTCQEQRPNEIVCSYFCDAASP